MSNAPNGSFEYLKSAVMTATPEQLHLMLLDGAIRFATKAQEELKRKNREAALNAFERAQQIALELTLGINREANPQLGDQFVALYNFVYRRLVDANLHQDERAVEDALRILRHQRETWLLIVQKLRGADSAASPPKSGPTSRPGQQAPTPAAARPAAANGAPAPRTNGYVLRDAGLGAGGSETRFMAEG